MVQERESKRRRVARACDSCRVLKAKCDGHQPVCGRCVGYGHVCQWNECTRRSSSVDNQRTRLSLLLATEETHNLRAAVRAYNQMLRDLRASLCENDRKLVDLGLSTLPQVLSETDVESPAMGAAAESTFQVPCTRSLGLHFSSQRYLGETSDIRFFGAMKQVLSECASSRGPYEVNFPGLDSYEQEEIVRDTTLDRHQAFFPTREEADKCLEVYFATVHIAYPFVWQPAFSIRYEEFWRSESLENVQGLWLSLLLTLVAIGACYEFLSDVEVGTAPRNFACHQQYFHRALQIAQQYESNRSLDYIWTLLAQCFYLLATCQTDRCWTTLGLAVRVAHSIGLHVEDTVRIPEDGGSITISEMRRRTWYSIYVLDRLLALQLGRPPAIHEGDFDVVLPSRSDGELWSDNACAQDKARDEENSTGDYFLVMIQFSKIIGSVLSGLYSPSKAASAEDTLSTIEDLDQDLLGWRNNLPRRLRFEAAHTFENSITFKRQRNFLAVKFYNLRALIHRPHLSPAKLAHSYSSPSVFLESEGRRIRRSKRTCLLAAQKTAQLLHNIEDKKSLVYGFPWWQMISCLICASSILLVASICIDREQEAEEIDWGTVDEDAEVCLTVFQALSTNSNAARLARDMMQGLKDTRLHMQSNVAEHQFPEETHSQAQGTNVFRDTSSITFDNTLSTHADMANEASEVGFQQLAYDVSEPVMWSAQFVNAAYNPFLSRPRPLDL